MTLKAILWRARLHAVDEAKVRKGYTAARGDVAIVELQA